MTSRGLLRRLVAGTARDLPPHPYRDVEILHLCLASVLVVVAWLGAGGAARALAIASGCAVAAILWSWLRIRQRTPRPAERSGS